MKRLSALQRAARRSGIQTSFIDSVGQERFASEETLARMMAELQTVDPSPKASPVEPVLVHWQTPRRSLATTVWEKPRRIELEWPGGGRRVPLRGVKMRELASGAFRVELALPDLPAGYYDLIFALRSGEKRSMLISAPRKFYGELTRQWGLFVPLYAVHSEQSWGAGNFSDWQGLAQWVGKHGGAVVGALPIMSTFLDRPKCEPSPYSPVSRLFWNEFFIDVPELPEFKRSAAARRAVESARFQAAVRRFRASEWIDYSAEWASRREILSILAREFFSADSPRRAEFDRFLLARPEVRDYARFRAACDQSGVSWQAWEAQARAGKLRSRDYDETAAEFYAYSQWAAHEQINAALAACRGAGVKFYLDLPVGIDADGYDAWRFRDFFVRGVSAGAPPDCVFTQGQNWGLAPLHPRCIRELRYRYLIDYLRFQMRQTGLLRIDHVMGLHRLWWIPHGFPASAGAYVRYPADELYAILSVESHQSQTTLIGENLGTVPPEVNVSMDRHGLRRMYVVQGELPATGPLPQPETRVAASVNTHDMPMFAAHWQGLDILDRRDLGWIPSRDVPREKRQRAERRQNLMRFLRKQGLLARRASSRQAVLEGVLKFLARSPAETVLVTLEDLWGEERPQNVPGTSTERPNWRRKMSKTLEELRADPTVIAWLQSLRRHP